MECEPASCSLFAPGDRHCIIGTKTGKLQIFDINATMCLETIDAHESSVSSIDMSPNQCSLVSGSADKDVKFWDFELIKDTTYSETRKKLTLVHARTLKLSDDVLCIKHSPNGKLIAISLLDSTVKIFFVDTLKFFLSLFGHKFPVICMDISYDSNLIITGSADRNVKIWGLDFGDCHRSIFAHDESIMCMKFIPKTHMFFTGGKDKTIKQWDADNFKKINTLRGHQSEIWAIAVSPDGRRIVTSSHDKSLRLWCKTEEILVLQEEEEMEREEEYEKSFLEESNKDTEEPDEESGLASKKTIETIKSAEQIIEALDIYTEETSKYELYKKECEISRKELPQPLPHVMFSLYDVTSPIEFMLEVVKRIKSSELEKALLLLPFNYIEKFLLVLCELLEKGWETEIVCRCVHFLVSVHCKQIIKNENLYSVIENLQKVTEQQTKSLKDIYGYNLHALNFMARDIIESEEISLFIDASRKYKKRRRRQKKIERAVAVNKIAI
ncbi:WD repeat-containing protein 3-like [Centruroides sculpturatus]|uniref:WD repeat-containing protein 3-like n=1 Tax=Centruroides sculpturatus TaxID=218467 RepID=UPI000C6D299B|nr:WD repeat-containing protein 3-like [Centruroides sculpturatus]